MSFFSAVADVAKFVVHCKTHGWSTKPAYSPHIYSALRRYGTGWASPATDKFVKKFALDAGGTGPVVA